MSGSTVDGCWMAHSHIIGQVRLSVAATVRLPSDAFSTHHCLSVICSRCGPETDWADVEGRRHSTDSFAIIAIYTAPARPRISCYQVVPSL